MTVIRQPTLVNVPNVAGVPAVAFAAPTVLPALLQSDLVSPFAAVFGPQWGIFSGGAPIITAESVTGFEFRNDWTVSDYPVEGGVFESYDKVLQPYLAKVRFAAGSSPQARNSLLASVAAAAATITLYDVVTPEFTYLNCTISHYDYRREAQQGVGLIVVDVWVTQVIVQGTGLLASSVFSPASADTTSGGAISPTSVGVGGGNAADTPVLSSTSFA